VKHKLAIVVRADLGLSRGKLAAQVSHAAVDCALRARRYDRKGFRAWYDEGQRKVVVKVSDVARIYALREEARAVGLTTALITDAGLTQVPPGTVTCLGLGPAEEAVLDRLTGELKLL